MSIPSPDGRPRVDEALAYFLPRLGSGESRVTYEREVRCFFAFAGKDVLEQVLPRDLFLYEATLAQLAPATRRKRLAILRAFFRFAERSGLVAANPTDAVDLPVVHAPVRVLPGPEEVRALLAAPDRRTFRGQRDAAVLALLVFHGLRRREVCVLRVGSLTTHYRRPALVVPGKGGKTRLVTLARPVVDELVPWLGWLPTPVGPEAPLFWSTSGSVEGPHPITARILNHMVPMYAWRALIRDKRVTPHTLRHVAASFQLAGGADLLAVQRELGHSSLASTERYLHFVQELSRPPADSHVLNDIRSQVARLTSPRWPNRGRP